MWRMARPRKPLLSRDRIVAAAGALVDAEGLEAVSTRRLAAALGVSGPSLYNHFRTKDEILDAVADAVSARVDLSMFEPGRAGTGRPPCTTGRTRTGTRCPTIRTSCRCWRAVRVGARPDCGWRTRCSAP